MKALTREEMGIFTKAIGKVSGVRGSMVYLKAKIPAYLEHRVKGKTVQDRAGEGGGD